MLKTLENHSCPLRPSVLQHHTFKRHSCMSCHVVLWYGGCPPGCHRCGRYDRYDHQVDRRVMSHHAKQLSRGRSIGKQTWHQVD